MNTHIVTPYRSSRVGTRISSPTRIGRLALFVTATAALAAWVLAAVAHLSEHAVVITVMLAAFLASWIATNHRPVPKHRVTLIRVPNRVR
jgi:hypothetical protein